MQTPKSRIFRHLMSLKTEIRRQGQTRFTKVCLAYAIDCLTKALFAEDSFVMDTHVRFAAYHLETLRIFAKAITSQM